MVGSHARATGVGRAAARVSRRRAHDPSHRNRFTQRRGFDEPAWTRLANVNQFATLSAYVADTSQRTVRLHSSVSLTAENWLLARSIALHAMALQMTDAYGEAQLLAEAFSGSRPRRIRSAACVNARTKWSTSSTSISSAAMANRRLAPTKSPSSCTSSRGRGRWRRMSCCDSTPIWNSPPISPARLELDASEKHASLGSGLQMRLLLPVEPDAAIAQKLNANECVEPDAHQLGAWCVDVERGLLFSGFVPAAAYTPGLSRALVYHLSAKNEWARAVLFPAG